MADKVVNIQEAKTHLSRLLREVEAGSEVTIARAGKAIARIVRVEETGQRQWKIFEGQVREDPDAFDALDATDEWEGSVDP